MNRHLQEFLIISMGFIACIFAGVIMWKLIILNI